MRITSRFYFSFVLFLLGAGLLQAEGLNPAIQAKLDAIAIQVAEWAADPALVKAVAEQNAHLPAAYAEVTQEKWSELSDRDPLVRGFIAHPAADILRKYKLPSVTEAFLSDASGDKVAFLAKTTNWCHKGKPKHDVPMSGKTWQGKIEVDQSAGTRQIQIAVPVLDQGKPIGSLVVGIDVVALPRD